VGAGETPLFIPSEGHHLFAVWHLPAASRNGEAGCAFVFCPPFAEEEKCCHRVFVDMARELCRRGHPVLRIQFRGCGDSEGTFGEFTCSDWQQDIRNALSFVADKGYPKTGLLGLRLGASLAARVAEENLSVKKLILWEPIINGKQFMSLNLRRKLLRRMLTEKEGGTPTPLRDNDRENDTGIDFEGYWVSSQMQEEIAGINLLDEVKHYSGEVLLTQISSQKQPGKGLRSLAESYRAAGARVTVEAVVEQPIWNLLDLFHPGELIIRTAEWVGEA
jgi:exosortase A-associated hydrolase 2